MRFASLAFALSTSALSETLLVPEEFFSIQEAIDASSTGDTISVDEGYQELGTIVVPDTSNAIIVKGRGKTGATIDAEGGVCVRSLALGVEFENITFTNAGYTGNPGLGGAVGDVSSGRFTDCRFVDCPGGAAVNINRNALLNFDGCVFRNCTNDIGGAIRVDASLVPDSNTPWVSISSCVFEVCGGSSGGAVYLNGAEGSGPDREVQIDNCQFVGCTASGQFGGAVWSRSTDLVVSNTSFQSCTSAGDGGAICSKESGFDLHLLGCQFISCSASVEGGAVKTDAQEVRVESCTFQECSANNGGGFYGGYSDSLITQSHFVGNSAVQLGGACYAAGITFTSCTLDSNVSNAGAIYAPDFSCCGPSTVAGCDFLKNTSIASAGGAITGAALVSSSSFCEDTPGPFDSEVTDEGFNTFSETCSVVASCCLNSFCLTVDELTCLDAGGVLYVDECDSNPCPQLGACCTGNTIACVSSTEQDCLRFGHVWNGVGSSCSDSPCPTPCEGDTSGNGDVGLTDLISVLSNWGPCP